MTKILAKAIGLVENKTKAFQSKLEVRSEGSVFIMAIVLNSVQILKEYNTFIWPQEMITHFLIP